MGTYLEGLRGEGLGLDGGLNDVTRAFSTSGTYTQAPRWIYLDKLLGRATDTFVPIGSTNDGICVYEVLPSAGDHVDMAKVRCCWYVSCFFEVATSRVICGAWLVREVPRGTGIYFGILRLHLSCDVLTRVVL